MKMVFLSAMHAVCRHFPVLLLHFSRNVVQMKWRKCANFDCSRPLLQAQRMPSSGNYEEIDNKTTETSRSSFARPVSYCCDPSFQRLFCISGSIPCHLWEPP